MRLSIGSIGVDPPEPMLELVRHAEACGLEGVETAEHLGFHDAVVPSALYLQETSRIEVGLAGLNAGSRHPALLAMELASLAEIGDGRVRAKVGTGANHLMAQIGVDMVRPIPRVRSLVQVLRALHSGERLSGEYPVADFDDFGLRYWDGTGLVPHAGPYIPLDVMAVRPHMLQLAARVGDGAALPAASSAKYLAEAVRTLETELDAAERDRADFRISATAYGVIAENADQFLDLLRLIVSRFPASHAARIMTGVVDGVAYEQASLDNPGLAAETFLTADVLGQVTIFASGPADLLPVLQRYADTGIDALNIHLLSPVETRTFSVDAIATARAGL